MEQLRRSLVMLFVLYISLSTSVAHPRFDGRHVNHKHVRQQGAFASIQMISSPDGPNPTAPSPADSIRPGSLIITVPIPVPTMHSLSSPMDTIVTNAATRTFPTTVTQIPVATICSASFSPDPPVPYTINQANTTWGLNGTRSARPLLNRISSANNTTDDLPVVANPSIASPTATLADPSARVVLGDDGCQTLFTPVTTAVCRSVLSRGGQLPISVTDCGQWVTFSSSPVCGRAATAASAGPRTGVAETVAYFLAPWYEIASGAVPAEVEVLTCSSAGGTSDCWTAIESWGISTATLQSTVVRTAHFHGGAVGPLNLTLIPNFLTVSIPSSTTTTLSIDTTITHVSPDTVPTIIRLRQDPTTTTTTASAEKTVTTTVQVPTTEIYRLEAITHHTTVTVTVKETVPRTLTSPITLEEGIVTKVPTVQGGVDGHVLSSTSAS